ncbi:MAG: GGDEF domain-containing protein [Candidatus Margulisiibacteriota bacterium]
MGSIRATTVRRIYLTLAKSLGVELDRVVRRRFYNLIPRPVCAPDGRIIEGFLPHIAQRAVEVFPGKANAEELIRELKQGNLTAHVEELGDVYKAILKERETALKMIKGLKKLRGVNRRLLNLQQLVRELGVEPRENREIAARCIREALGFSGVRVYTVDRKRGTWFERYSEGEEGLSRFDRPRVPEANSEKGFLNRLLNFEIPLEEIEQAALEGLYEWQISEEWGYFYIPDRSRCQFVEMEQLRRDEEGDESQNRRGYGEGVARDDLYLIFGNKSAERIGIYMITNWAARKPLFQNKKEDLELLRTFAASLSRANELASAYQRLSDLSVIDELTQVHNRRYFNIKIQKEFTRAERYGHPLSLLMVDIDHFKKFNDTYGHLAGDEVLIKTAEVIQATLREDIDTVARWGGEEFAVILPETNGGRESAYQMAERLREAVQNLRIPVTTSNGEEVVGNVTISIGIATFPKNAASHGNLVLAADGALYEAKESGRNKVAVSQNTPI